MKHKTSDWIKKYHINKIVNWGLNISAIVMIITGFGITQYRIVESATLGLLTKPWSFKLHSIITYFFIVFLAARFGLNIYYKKKKV
ncbi:hypothetical protein ACFL6I_09235 [candidate division KSB1 bacterium]